MVRKLFKDAKTDILRYRKWLNFSLSGLAVIIALIIGFDFAADNFRSVLAQQASITPKYEVIYTSVNANLPKKIQESQDVFIVYDNKIKSLEKQLVDQGTLFSQQISMLNSLYSNTMSYFSILIGLLGILMLFGGIWLTRKFDNAYNQFLDIHKKIKNSQNKLSEAERLVNKSLVDVETTKESVKSLLNDAVKTKDEIIAFVENSNDKLYQRYEEERLNKIIRTLQQSPELINLFYNELLLDVDKLDYELLLDIRKKSTCKLKDIKLVAMYNHLLLLINPQVVCNKVESLDRILLPTLSKYLLAFYYPLDKYKIIINILSNYQFTAEDLKNHRYIKTWLVSFLEQFILVSDGSYFESILIHDMNEKEQDELINNLMSLSVKICQAYVNARQRIIKPNIKNTDKEYELLTRLKKIVDSNTVS